MSTSTVMPEATKPSHFADCDSLAIGRRVKAMVAEMPEGHDLIIGLRGLTSTANLDVHRGFCTCFQMQLNHVEAELTRHRKLQRLHGVRPGHTAAGDAAIIADLTARRDALRQAVAA